MKLWGTLTETGFYQGYGPFTLEEWVHDSHLTIIANLLAGNGICSQTEDRRCSLFSDRYFRCLSGIRSREYG